LNFNYFFLNTTQAARSLVKISTSLPVLNSPDSVLNISGLMKNKGKTRHHDGSLLIQNTTFLSFLSTLNGCCDASEINILVKIKKKSTFSILNNLYSVLN